MTYVFFFILRNKGEKLSRSSIQTQDLLYLSETLKVMYDESNDTWLLC